VGSRPFLRPTLANGGNGLGCTGDMGENGRDVQKVFQTKRCSGLKVIAEALTGHKGWKPVWRDPAPQSEYDYIIVGGGVNRAGFAGG
jgi:hypothetical protein